MRLLLDEPEYIESIEQWYKDEKHDIMPLANGQVFPRFESNNHDVTTDNVELKQQLSGAMKMLTKLPNTVVTNIHAIALKWSKYAREKDSQYGPAVHTVPHKEDEYNSEIASNDFTENALRISKSIEDKEKKGLETALRSVCGFRQSSISRKLANDINELFRVASSLTLGWHLEKNDKGFYTGNMINLNEQLKKGGETKDGKGKEIRAKLEKDIDGKLFNNIVATQIFSDSVLSGFFKEFSKQIGPNNEAKSVLDTLEQELRKYTMVEVKDKEGKTVDHETRLQELLLRPTVLQAVRFRTNRGRFSKIFGTTKDSKPVELTAKSKLNANSNGEEAPAIVGLRSFPTAKDVAFHGVLASANGIEASRFPNSKDVKKLGAEYLLSAGYALGLAEAVKVKEEKQKEDTQAIVNLMAEEKKLKSVVEDASADVTDKKRAHKDKMSKLAEAKKDVERTKREIQVSWEQDRKKQLWTNRITKFQEATEMLKQGKDKMNDTANKLEKEVADILDKNITDFEKILKNLDEIPIENEEIKKMETREKELQRKLQDLTGHENLKPLDQKNKNEIESSIKKLKEDLHIKRSENTKKEKEISDEIVRQEVSRKKENEISAEIVSQEVTSDTIRGTLTEKKNVAQLEKDKKEEEIKILRRVSKLTKPIALKELKKLERSEERLEKQQTIARYSHYLDVSPAGIKKVQESFDALRLKIQLMEDLPEIFRLEVFSLRKQLDTGSDTTHTGLNGEFAFLLELARRYLGRNCNNTNKTSQSLARLEARNFFQRLKQEIFLPALSRLQTRTFAWMSTMAGETMDRQSLHLIRHAMQQASGSRDATSTLANANDMGDQLIEGMRRVHKFSSKIRAFMDKTGKVMAAHILRGNAAKHKAVADLYINFVNAASRMAAEFTKEMKETKLRALPNLSIKSLDMEKAIDKLEGQEKKNPAAVAYARLKQFADKTEDLLKLDADSEGLVTIWKGRVEEFQTENCMDKHGIPENAATVAKNKKDFVDLTGNDFYDPKTKAADEQQVVAVMSEITGAQLFDFKTDLAATMRQQQVVIAENIKLALEYRPTEDFKDDDKTADPTEDKNLTKRDVMEVHSEKFRETMDAIKSEMAFAEKKDNKPENKKFEVEPLKNLIRTWKKQQPGEAAALATLKEVHGTRWLWPSQVVFQQKAERIEVNKMLDELLTKKDSLPTNSIKGIMIQQLDIDASSLPRVPKKSEPADARKELAKFKQLWLNKMSDMALQSDSEKERTEMKKKIEKKKERGSSLVISLKGEKLGQIWKKLQDLREGSTARIHSLTTKTMKQSDHSIFSAGNLKVETEVYTDYEFTKPDLIRVLQINKTAPVFDMTFEQRGNKYLWSKLAVRKDHGLKKKQM